MTHATCPAAGCSKKIAYVGGFCITHQRRARLYGDPLKTAIASPSLTLEQRLSFHGWTIMQRRDGLTPCWEFDGPRNRGYGQVSVEGKHRLASRIAYEVWVGPLLDGAVVRHTCDNPPCINPEHLLAGTQADNVHDAVERGRAYVPDAPRGEAQHNAKMTESDVRRIRAMRAEGQTFKTIADRFGVTTSAIFSITSRHTWAWLDDDGAA